MGGSCGGRVSKFTDWRVASYAHLIYNVPADGVLTCGRSQGVSCCCCCCCSEAGSDLAGPSDARLLASEARQAPGVSAVNSHHSYVLIRQETPPDGAAGGGYRVLCTYSVYIQCTYTVLYCTDCTVYGVHRW